VNSFTLKHLFWIELSNKQITKKTTLSDLPMRRSLQNFAAGDAKKKRAVFINELIVISRPKFL